MLIKPIPWKLRKFKKGDIIVSDNKVAIFESIGHHPDGGSNNDDSYFFVYGWCWLDDPLDYFNEDGYIRNVGARLARLSERKFLFMKLEEIGYLCIKTYRNVRLLRKT